MPIEHSAQEPAAIGIPSRRHPASPVRLGFVLRCRLRARHTLLLGREVRRYGIEQRLWWLLPLIVVIVLLAAAITTTTTALPVAVYTLF